MTSEESLEMYHRVANNISIIPDDSKHYETIKKDLERLEKLEKVIEILKDKANIYCSLSNIACPYYILINPHNDGYEHSDTNRSYIYFDNKEDVELIKEVLEK